jgi:hypothetical protein
MMQPWLTPAVWQVVLGLTVLGIIVAIALLGLKRLRERIDEDKASPSQLLSNFHDLHQQGGLTDAEFRTIKTVLGAKLQQGSKPVESKPRGGANTSA